MATERLESLEQVRAFVEGSDGLDFVGSDRPSRNDFVRRVLVKFGYRTLGKADKGLVKRFLGKATGLSRAQLTRLVRQHARTGRIVDRLGARHGTSPFVQAHFGIGIDSRGKAPPAFLALKGKIGEISPQVRIYFWSAQLVRVKLMKTSSEETWQ